MKFCRLNDKAGIQRKERETRGYKVCSLICKLVDDVEMPPAIVDVDLLSDDSGSGLAAGGERAKVIIERRRESRVRAMEDLTTSAVGIDEGNLSSTWGRTKKQSPQKGSAQPQVRMRTRDLDFLDQPPQQLRLLSRWMRSPWHLSSQLLGSPRVHSPLFMCAL